MSELQALVQWIADLLSEYLYVGVFLAALLLPIIAFFISLKEPSKGLGVMIIIAGILIIIGGIAVISNPSPENIDRDPIGSAVMLFAPAVIQLALGAIKIKKSSR